MLVPVLVIAGATCRDLFAVCRPRLVYVLVANAVIRVVFGRADLVANAKAAQPYLMGGVVRFAVL